MKVTSNSEFTPSLPVPLRDVLPEGAFIYGIGVDVAQVGPFRRRPPLASDTFYGLIFTDAERDNCRLQADPAAAFAACFAAKQAAVKVLGARHAVKVPQVEVLQEDDRTGWMSARVVSRRGEPVRAPEVEMIVIIQEGQEVVMAFVVAHGPAAPVTDALDASRHDREGARRSLGGVAAYGGEIVFSYGADQLRDKVYGARIGMADY
jgi:phosphopantetheinyl transferase (holo-ACP synthase)